MFCSPPNEDDCVVPFYERHSKVQPRRGTRGKSGPVAQVVFFAMTKDEQFSHPTSLWELKITIKQRCSPF